MRILIIGIRYGIIYGQERRASLPGEIITLPGSDGSSTFEILSMIFRRARNVRAGFSSPRIRLAKLVEAGARTRRIETTFFDAEITERTLVAVRTATTWCTARTREGNREKREREYKRRPARLPCGSKNDEKTSAEQRDERQAGRKRGCRISRTKEQEEQEKQGPERTQCTLRRINQLFRRESRSGPASNLERVPLEISGGANEPYWELREPAGISGRSRSCSRSSAALPKSPFEVLFVSFFFILLRLASSPPTHACLSRPKFVRP